MSYHARYCGLPPEALDFYSFSALRSTSPRDNGRPFHSDRERDTQSKDKIGTWPKRHMTKKYTAIPGLHVVAAIPNSQDHSYDLTLLRFNCCLSKMVSIPAYTSKLMGKRQDSLCCLSCVYVCVALHKVFSKQETFNSSRYHASYPAERQSPSKYRRKRTEVPGTMVWTKTQLSPLTNSILFVYFSWRHCRFRKHNP